MGEPGRILYVQGLKEKLTRMGYRDSFKDDSNTNIYVTVDSSHANDASMGYLSFKNAS